jgi:GPH family glycoside/pentoside/hexuronide:cation symporter
MSVRFSWGQKWAFGAGSFAQWFINTAFNLWVFYYYFAVIRLDIRWYVLAAVIWSLWNAFNDPLIGYLSDRTHTRWGRRKPYIMLGTIPMLILEIVLWLPPLGNQFATFVYLLIMLLCYDTFYTMIALPFDSLFPELYTSVKERSQVNTIKQLLAIVGLIAAALVPGFIVDRNAPSYFLNGIVTSIIVGISLIISLKWGVTERKEFKLDYQQSFKFFQGLKYTLKNKGFILYTLIFFIYEYVLLLLATLVQIFGRQILNADEFQTSVIMGVMYIMGAISVLLWRWLDLKIGSKKGLAISVIA